MNTYLNRRNNDLSLFAEEDAFFANLFGGFTKDSRIMKTDIKETEKDYVLLIDVPGFDKKDIKISLDQKYLTVTATSKKDIAEGEKFLKQERFYGTVTRSFYVGEVEQKAINASFTNGVLQIKLPKHNYKKVEERKYIDIN